MIEGDSAYFPVFCEAFFLRDKFEVCDESLVAFLVKTVGAFDALVKNDFFHLEKKKWYSSFWDLGIMFSQPIVLGPLHRNEMTKNLYRKSQKNDTFQLWILVSKFYHVLTIYLLFK